MKKLPTVFFGVLALVASPAFAGFTELATSEPVRIFGVANPAADPFFIPEGPSSDGGLTFDLPDYLTLLDIRDTEFELPDEDDGELEEVGTLFDAVFRDTTDGKLVFGSRIVMDEDEEGEINDIFRSGFAGFSAAAGWVAVTANDLRLFSAARSSNSGLTTDDPDPFDDDVVALGTDLNVEELNPISAWYLVKTDATGWVLRDDAIGLFQAGEEDQGPYLASLEGFAPVPVPAALPLLLSGLGLLVARGRRAAASGV